MRQPQPFYRSAKKAYYCQIGKRQFSLGPDEKEAWKKFHRLMADGAPAKPTEPPTVILVCDQFLDFVQRTGKPDTYKWRRHFLQSFCKQFGTLKVTELKPKHVTSWLNSRGWGASTRYSAIASVKRAISWAMDEGHCDGFLTDDPLRKLKKPAYARREVMLSEEDRQRIEAAVKDRAFKRYLFALGQTGCRPGEIRTVTTDNVHGDTWVFTDHKETHHGKPRVIFLNEAMRLLVTELVAENPTGPLFLNSRGKPWTQNAVRIRFRNLRLKLGLPKGSVAYCYRHAYATDMLHKGYDPLTVAQLLGHSSTKMLERHYAHLSNDHLRKAVEGQS
jgi:integrase/recombinase XerC